MSEEIELDEKWDTKAAVRFSQESSLSKCGYGNLKTCTGEQLKDFIQAETLKSLITVKRIGIAFAIIIGISIMVSIIVLFNVLG